jgi:adenosylhomocysteine nucleosidase
VKLGLVCGLASEKKALGEAGRAARLSGAEARRAETMARILADEGAEMLVSIGLAGALSPALRPGDLVLPSAVIDEQGARLEAASLPDECQSGDLLGADHIIDGPAAKSRLLSATGAVAVDMESHAVARVAAGRGIRFVIIRAIADPATQALPPTALGAVGPDGEVKTWTTVARLLRRPQDLPDLVRLGRQAAQGLQTLRDRVPPILTRIERL